MQFLFMQPRQSGGPSPEEDLGHQPASQMTLSSVFRALIEMTPDEEQASRAGPLRTIHDRYRERYKKEDMWADCRPYLTPREIAAIDVGMRKNSDEMKKLPETYEITGRDYVRRLESRVEAKTRVVGRQSDVKWANVLELLSHQDLAAERSSSRSVVRRGSCASQAALEGRPGSAGSVSRSFRGAAPRPSSAARPRSA